MQMVTTSPDDRAQDVEPSEWHGHDELLSSLGAALRAKSGKEAVAKLINSFAEDNPKRSQRQYRTMLWGYALSAFVIVVIGLLGWLQVLNKETVGTL